MGRVLGTNLQSDKGKRAQTFFVVENWDGYRSELRPAQVESQGSGPHEPMTGTGKRPQGARCRLVGLAPASGRSATRPKV